jgi:hypothetical protein
VGTYLLMLALQPPLVWLLARGLAGRRRAAEAVMAVGGAIILFKAVVKFRPVWEATVFPFPDYVKYQGFVLYLGVAVFFGACLAWLAGRRERPLIALLGVVAVAQSGFANTWLLDRAEYGEERFADESHHCRQSTMFTCGPAAGVSALAHCGVRVSERQMAALCLTNKEGTGDFNIYRGLTLALAGTPWRARLCSISAQALAAEGTLAVVSLEDHAIATVGEGGGRLLVHDPLGVRPERRTARELETFYSGTAVVIERR